MSKITRHPKEATLAAFAAGALDEAMSVVIGAHAAMCPSCRAAVRAFETVGGICVEAIDPAPMRADALEHFWSRAGEQELAPAVSLARGAGGFALPASHPLSRYLNEGVDAIKWRQVAPGFMQHVIPAQGYRPGVLRLLRVSPGGGIPPHTHADEELTLLLKGSYRDETGEYRAGDLSDMDGEIVHAPVATGTEECVCLIATSAPLRFRTLVGRVVQPFIGL